MTQNGTVNIMYTGVSGPGVPSTLWLGVAIGTPSGEGCAATSTVNAPPGGTAQVSGTYAPGVYCAKVSDIGNLFSPATVSVVIAHP